MAAAMPASWGGMIWQPLPQYTYSNSKATAKYRMWPQHHLHSKQASKQASKHLTEQAVSHLADQQPHPHASCSSLTSGYPNIIKRTSQQSSKQQDHICLQKDHRTLYPLYSLVLCEAVTITPAAHQYASKQATSLISITGREPGSNTPDACRRLEPSPYLGLPSPVYRNLQSSQASNKTHA
jgi:hypothetical protein